MLETKKNLRDLEINSQFLTNPGLEKEFKGRVPTISKAMQREMVHNKNANTKSIFLIKRGREMKVSEESGKGTLHFCDFEKLPLFLMTILRNTYNAQAS